MDIGTVILLRVANSRASLPVERVLPQSFLDSRSLTIHFELTLDMDDQFIRTCLRRQALRRVSWYRHTREIISICTVSCYYNYIIYFCSSIRPTENTFLSVLIAGEGYHNYHHVFPWDYKAQESSVRGLGNITTIFLDAFATIGWVYDRKTVSADMVKRRVRKTGDGSHETWGGRDECDEHQEQSEDYATVFWRTLIKRNITL